MPAENKLCMASDHAGFKLKNALKEFLSTNGYFVEDLGPYAYDPEDDYPDYAAKVCERVIETKGKGILVCGTGQGMDRVANKFPGIYASVCWDELSARVAKEHADVNVLCLGERIVGEDLAKRIVEIWLKSEFKGGRHERRVDKTKDIEKENMK